MKSTTVGDFIAAMKSTTVGDLIAALSKYPVTTPIVGLTTTGDISSVLSIQEAPTAEYKLLNISLHFWPYSMITEDTVLLGRVAPAPEPLPRIVPLDPIPANANPFHYDLYHMGVGVTGPWMAMYSEHYGLKPEYNQTAEEKVSMKPVWHDDPKYIILINQRTGQRFKMIWDQVPKEDFSEVMQAMMRQRELEERGD
jgi:hypothetical protein